MKAFQIYNVQNDRTVSEAKWQKQIFLSDLIFKDLRGTEKN